MGRISAKSPHLSKNPKLCDSLHKSKHKFPLETRARLQSLSLPANKGFCPLTNMKKLHGWSTWNVTGGNRDFTREHDFLIIPVAAAASVPFSSTDITALCIASDTNTSALPAIPIIISTIKSIIGMKYVVDRCSFCYKKGSKQNMTSKRECRFWFNILCSCHYNTPNEILTTAV